MIGRVALAVNPTAGKGRSVAAGAMVADGLAAAGIEVLALSGGSASELAAAARGAIGTGVDALVVVGGDGVISLALQALAHSDIPLGIVPAGTGNDHAREYRLPTADPEGAVDIIAAGHLETVDLGLIKGSDRSSTWFGTVAATGFDSLVSDRVNRMSWPHGRMRYNVAMVAELSKLRLLPFRLVLDGQREIVTRLTLAAFGNTRSYGGGMQICPGANHSDGMLDITMVHSASRTRLIRLFPTVFKGTHVDLDEVRVDRARTITAESPGINAYADGDYVCPLPAEISAVPGALKIFVPA